MRLWVLVETKTPLSEDEERKVEKFLGAVGPNPPMKKGDRYSQYTYAVEDYNTEDVYSGPSDRPETWGDFMTRLMELSMELMRELPDVSVSFVPGV
jgi:hypothetical protein